jgi:cellulose synthase/poly-beta-1,6-N-acetylglucosamine synthase-like glycosyltransferase
MEIIIVIIYSLALIMVFFYSIIQLDLLINYLKNHKQQTTDHLNIKALKTFPKVTVQLPVYNEKYVVNRLINRIVELDYPSHLLEIHLLDDSTDDSRIQIDHLIHKHQQSGVDISVLRRADRTGYKAGALKHWLPKAKGEFIAIFDADFLPPKDWLKKTLPHFSDSHIGVVQTRWEHLNRNFSLLTKIQAFALDFHFIIEQLGRNSAHHFINFNGTAGVWRKACILDAGNWQGDTLTEDLDLSYRAQMKKWKFKYVPQIEAPAEIPAVVSAARSQQFRWNKGAAENFKKNFGKLLKTKGVSAKTKFHAFFHLLNSSMFLIILLIAVLSVPILFIKANHPELKYVFYGLAGFAVSTLIFFICYWTSYTKVHGGGFKNFIKFAGMFIAFFSVAMGFSLHNTIAILEGHLGKKSGFIRTPKFNIQKLGDSFSKNIYLNTKLSGIQFMELLLFAYFGFGLYAAFLVDDFGLFIFHLMLSFGFGFVSFQSIYQGFIKS